MLQSSEEFLGEYIWGSVNILIVPNFPDLIGGMENPHLITISQHLIEGNRKFEWVIAHEIVHQWFGNMLNYANFEHFWINEGLAAYAEKTVMGHLYGDSFRNYRGLEKWRSLENEIVVYKNPFSALVNNLTGNCGIFYF